MTDEQINAAIAEAINADPHWKCAKNYCTDLNAMHEAEKMLTIQQKANDYEILLETVTRRGKSGMTFGLAAYLFCHATARQRAEAFLRTLGKWEATDKESLTVQQATTEESSAVQSTSSGGSGGASTYGCKGLGIAGATWPPETRITVNGKTFCLADIDKEMTE
jgi:hypothetical protein